MQYQINPVIGIEIEFYLNNICPDAFKSKLNITNIVFKDEKGCNQYEITVPPSKILTNYAMYIEHLKKQMHSIAELLGGNINFHSKPFINDYGSSMHFHINFLDNDNNQLTSNDFLTHTAKSLCHFMQSTTLAFLPNKSDYLRLDNNFMAPTHIAYGFNNRSVAVRIPDKYPKRLEHRLASSSCDPYLVMFVILEAILQGLAKPNSINNLQPIYGNAFDSQYNLQSIPKSKIEAIKLWRDIK